MKYLIEEATLTGIANAIRGKKGTTDLIQVSNLATEISNIQGGGTVEELTITSNGTYTPPTGIDGYAPVVVNVPQDGSPPAEAFNITGDCRYRFANNGWNWFVEKYGNQTTTSNITDLETAFYNSYLLTSIPFELNCNFSTFIKCPEVFSSCSSLTKAPRINVLNSDSVIRMPYLYNIFSWCYRLTDIDYDYFSHWFSEEQWEQINNGSSDHTVDNLFHSCYSLRKHPDISMLYSTDEYIGIYNRTFNSCYCLDQVLDMPVWNANLTDNKFFDTCIWDFRLKNLTFKTNIDGTPKTANWSNQTINLTSYIGYIDTNQFNNYIKNYGPATGITEDKKVSDDATYQALKDDPNWYALGINYSRYNHNSAVNTINSLPDTSAYLTANGGTNTIKFSGASGALTDGGAINTLTEEEIAVATAKGWTVSLV